MRAAPALPVASLLLCLVTPALATQRPTPVSPGEPERVVAVGRCPTFSWAPVAGAAAHELIVYRVRDEEQPSEPVLRREIPGAASAWTPGLDGCLEPGAVYAWSVRAVGSGETDWSAPVLFEVRSPPGVAELTAMVEQLRRSLTARAEPGEPVVRPQADPSDSSTASSSPDSAASTPALGLPPVSSMGTGELTVEGELRTVDPAGDPRLWGRGRLSAVVYHTNEATGESCTHTLLAAGGQRDPVEIKFGLSSLAVGWGSAADACPAGTWVCKRSEISAAGCDTNRPDGATDVWNCDGSPMYDRPASDHVGWIADSFPGSVEFSRAFSEGGSDDFPLFHCSLAPVWCCWH